MGLHHSPPVDPRIGPKAQPIAASVGLVGFVGFYTYDMVDASHFCISLLLFEVMSTVRGHVYGAPGINFCIVACTMES